jgi:hypothetical protein
MIRNEYHCLIAGLPEISPYHEKTWISLKSFRDLLKEELQPEDFELVRRVLFRYDNENLAGFMLKGDIDEEKPGVFTLDDFREQAEMLKEIQTGKSILPLYMVEAMNWYYNTDDKPGLGELSKRIAEGYYDFMLSAPGMFLPSFTRFEYDLKNLAGFIESAKHNSDPVRYLTGSGSLAAHLSNYPDGRLIKDPEYDLFEELVTLSQIESISEKEFRYDLLSLKFIEDTIFFEDFSIDWVLGYLNMLFILDRWTGLDHLKGEKKLRNTLTEKKGKITDRLKEKTLLL